MSGVSKSWEDATRRRRDTKRTRLANRRKHFEDVSDHARWRKKKKLSWLSAWLRNRSSTGFPKDWPKIEMRNNSFNSSMKRFQEESPEKERSKRSSNMSKGDCHKKSKRWPSFPSNRSPENSNYRRQYAKRRNSNATRRY